MTRWFTHGEPVIRTADGRTGTVKDIEGYTYNVRWDDDGTKSWEPLEALEPAPVTGK